MADRKKGHLPGLPVVRPGSPASYHVGALLPGGGDGPQDDELFDDAGADFLGDASLDRGQEELELFGPGGGVVRTTSLCPSKVSMRACSAT